MKVRLFNVELPLQHEFTIARGSISVQRSLIVELECDGVCGYGEATENAYYGFTLESMTDAVKRCESLLQSYEFGDPGELWSLLKAKLGAYTFTLSAIDLAAHDLHGKLASRRTFEMLGMDWGDVPKSSYTIGIDTTARMLEKMAERPGWDIYKIKLGTDRDVQIIRELRARTTAVFRVDANCGWTVDEAIDNSIALKELGVEFIEQPLPADAAPEDHRRLYDQSVLPIVADESCLVESDVPKCRGLFHGINVKLCKCGGLTPAVRMLRQARSWGMKTMVGCMVESTVGISAAAQLLPLLDYADLDGAELIVGDTAWGVVVDNGAARLPDRFGSGVALLDSLKAVTPELPNQNQPQD